MVNSRKIYVWTSTEVRTHQVTGGQAKKPISSLQMCTLNVVSSSLSGLIVKLTHRSQTIPTKNFWVSRSTRLQWTSKVPKNCKILQCRPPESHVEPPWALLDARHCAWRQWSWPSSQLLISTSYHFNLYYKEKLVSSVTIFACEYWELYKMISLTRSISALLLQPGLDVLCNMTTLWSRFLSPYLWHHR